jgi:phage baseplate assembly protein W
MSANGISKSFLGQGWKFPISLNDLNKIEISEYEQNIKESIMIILGTRKNERVMRPDFGCGIHDFVFEVISSSRIGHMETSITDALTRFEPRIELLDVDISIDKSSNGVLIIKISYMVIKTNNRFNIVYPFYISEGGV